MLTLHVSKKADVPSHYFHSLSEAIESLPATSEEVTIHLHKGEYYEKVNLLRSNITIVGDSAGDCIITYDDNAYMPMPDGSKRGTFRSYTMFIDGENITLKNLTIRNSSRPRSQVGQSIALYADGDNISVISCRLESLQDTLFTGPLPKKVIQKGGFVGPKEFSKRVIGHQYYKDCYICGDIDFIFGSAIAYFEDCEIASIFSEELTAKEADSEVIYGYATAASTYEGCKYGYVFYKCRFTSTCKEGSVYLGRPWRDYAKTVLINCYLGPHIHKAHFHDWNKENARNNCFYAEYGCYGEGSSLSNAAPFVKPLSKSELPNYAKEAVMTYHFNKSFDVI